MTKIEHDCSLHNLGNGALAGVAGGLVFGAMMAAQGMMPMIGQMVGMPTATVGFIVHMVISVITGGLFAAIFCPLLTTYMTGTFYGALYGIGWWFLGPLTLMPYFLGMELGVNWNLAAMERAMPSFYGHVIFGVVVGLTYIYLKRK